MSTSAGTKASHASASNGSKWWSSGLLAAGGALALLCGMSSEEDSVAGRMFGLKRLLHACGIVAFVGDEPATPYLLEGLQILQNRGYDSAGIATLSQSTGSLVSSKFASVGSTSDCIDLLVQHAPGRHDGDTLGIAHTRWATHGGKTDANAHPHLDSKERVAIVHNGTIENSGQLKAELQKQGVQFKSQTDTEVIAQLIGHYLDQNMNILDAVQKTLSRLEGTWGLAIIHKDSPGQVIAARNGSPLVLGIGKNRMFVASELSAFSRHTNQYISLNDGEVAVVTAEGSVALDTPERRQTAPEEVIELSPAPYPHWTIKEIMEQPEAISRTLNYGARFNADGLVKLGGLEANKELLLNIRHLLMAACGTSLFASQYGAHLFKSLKCFDTVQTIDAAEVTSESFPAHQGGLVVASQSGETKDTHRSVVVAADQLIPCFSVVNQVGSLIARSTNCGVYLNAGREHAVASTKAFTTQVTAFALVAGWFAQNRAMEAAGEAAGAGAGGQGSLMAKGPMFIHSQRRAELIEAIHRLPIYTGMTLLTRPQCARLAQELVAKDAQHMFILGKGFGESIAKEGALKIKEVTYVHAEGFSGGALKHGPFALLQQGTPVVCLVLNDQHAELMRIAAIETRARGAHTIVITDKPSLAEGLTSSPDDVIVIPSNGPLSALLAVVPLQLMAYEMAVKKGINPDKPKNLAKAVTVD